MVLNEQDRQAAGSAMVAIIAIIGFAAIYLAAHSFGAEAATFPKLVAVLGGLSAMVCLLRSRRALSALRAGGLGGLTDDGTSRMNFALSYVAPAIYAAMLYVLGFWVASASGLIALFALLGERRPVLVIGLTALTLGLIYILFDLSFGIRMPGSAVFEFLGRS